VTRDIEKALRRYAQELGLIPPFDTAIFAQKLSDRSGYTIQIAPRAADGTTIYGACAPNGVRFIIYYCENAGYVQRQRIIWHELAHIALGHVTPTSQHLERFVPTPAQEKAAEAWAQAMTALAGGRIGASLHKARGGFGQLLQALEA